MESCLACGARLGDAPWCPVCLTRRPATAPVAVEPFRPPNQGPLGQAKHVPEFSRIRPSSTAFGNGTQIVLTVIVGAFMVWRLLAFAAALASGTASLILVDEIVEQGVGIAFLGWLWRRRRVR